MGCPSRRERAGPCAALLRAEYPLTVKPIVILDANPLNGLKSFSSAYVKEVLALAKSAHVRLVIPDVVVRELARQGAKSFNDKHSSLRNAGKNFTDLIEEAHSIGLSVAPASVEIIGPPLTDRNAVYDAMSAFLHRIGVEMPIYPAVTVEDLLDRDLDRRRPFADSGKGFRDALTWETVRELCGRLRGPDTLVILVTRDGDFRAEKEKALHPHLLDDLEPGQRIEIVDDVRELLEHERIKPLAERLRVVSESLTQQRVTSLVDRALTELGGHELETVGFYAPGEVYDSPIRTELDDVAFNGVDPDNDTIGFEIFRTGYDHEMTIRVTVDADCDIEGFIDKSTFLVSGSQFTYYEDWNRHRFRAIEPHRVRFTLSADFTESTVDDIALTVDEVEEVAP